MKALKLGRFDNVRFWYDDSPDVIGQADRSERKLHGPPLHTVCLEWYAPRGGHFLYGLLGATSLGGPTPATTTLDIPPPSPLRGFDTPVDLIDRVTLGLAAEFSDCVARAAAEACRVYLREGVVVFDAAVSGHVGSSEFVFSRLAKTIVRIIAMGEAHSDEDRVAAVLREELLQSS